MMNKAPNHPEKTRSNKIIWVVLPVPSHDEGHGQGTEDLGDLRENEPVLLGRNAKPRVEVEVD